MSETLERQAEAHWEAECKRLGTYPSSWQSMASFAQSQLSAHEKRIAELEAERDRYKKVLEHYADESIWPVFAGSSRWAHIRDWYDNDSKCGYEIAQQALTTKEADK